MNRELQDFITQWQDGTTEVWFLTPAGVIHGKLAQNRGEVVESIILFDAVYIPGGEPLDLGIATILADQISGWGVSPKISFR